MLKDIDGNLLYPGFQVEDMRNALVELCETIEVTGGLQWSTRYQGYVPCGDVEWSDLATAYLIACKALDRKPVLGDEEREANDA